MEVYVAKFDYEKEREDLLSFKEGDKFRVASKADKKWWAAIAEETGDYGYVPSSYMEFGVFYKRCIAEFTKTLAVLRVANVHRTHKKARYVDPSEEELIHDLSESDTGAQKRQALQELKSKVRQTPTSTGSTAESTECSEEESGSESEKTEEVIIKPLKSLSTSSTNDSELVQPKKLYNPVMASKPHVRLHKELKFTHARGGIQSILGKPELQKVMQRRKVDADGKPGSIRPHRNNGSQGCLDNDLATQLARRSQAVDNDVKPSEERQEPEFVKIALRKRPQVQ